MLYANHEFFEQSAYPIEKAIDTMGAGDSLITTFMVGYLDRKKKGSMMMWQQREHKRGCKVCCKSMSDGRCIWTWKRSSDRCPENEIKE